MIRYKFKYEECSIALYKALQEDAFYKSLEEKVEGDFRDKKSTMLRYMDYSIQEGELFGAIHYLEQNQGVSIWSKPLSKTLSQQKKQAKTQFIKEQMGEKAWKHYDKVVKAMSSHTEPLIPQNAWYLSIVGVHPDLQNQGWGSQLIQPILEQTDKMKIPTYLETFNARNISFYQRLGYKIVASFEGEPLPSKYWVLVR